MQIESVILYSHAGEKQEIPFSLGEVNVLSGPSGKGKSALLSVIDYCLGASKFLIPAGIISNSVSWFALKLVFPSTRLFVARRGVTTGRNASSEFCMHFGFDDSPLPFEQLRANAGKDDVIDKISSLLGVGLTFIPRAGGEIERKKLTFRSGLIYSFQKQNEIANPDLFFHRQSELASVVRETLPYYLGAISPAIIEKQAELKAKRKRLREIERALERGKSVALHRDKELELIVNEAIRLDLVTNETKVLISHPLQAVEHVKSAVDAHIDFRSTPKSNGEEVLRGLGLTLIEITRRRTDLIKEIEALEIFDHEQGGVDRALNEQRRRMKAIHLLATDHDDTHCPVCESALQETTPSVALMNRSLEKLASDLAFIDTDRRDLREHLANKRAALTSVNGEIRRIRQEIDVLKVEREAIGQFLEYRNELARLSGMIDMFIRLIALDDDDARSLLANEKERLLQEIETLEDETNRGDVTAKTASFMGAIGQRITGWAVKQDLEYADGLLTFDLRGPRLVSETADETIPFSRFGSGRNWVWYHLLGHFALHDWFIDKKRPTPRFIVLDQPSQVYFPSSDGQKGEQDWGEVRKIYQWLFETAKDRGGNLQIIVTDHAKFEDDPEFMAHLKHDWWKGGSLVPPNWEQ